jgi:tRNA(fMet)-specific endonuclease VapC
MTGDEVALDTNQAIQILNGIRTTGEWLVQYASVFLPVVVIGELKYGALNSASSDKNLAKVQQLADEFRTLEISSNTTIHYARTRVSLKQSGTPIPENDLWIAAICLEHNLPLATADAHFSRVTGLKVVFRPGSKS